MPRLSDLGNVLVGCRVVTRDRWEEASDGAGGDLARTLDALVGAPPYWWDNTPPTPPGLTEYQRWAIETRFAENQLADLPHDLTLNRFLLLDRLGRGGQGEVYRGRQLNPPRFVAIKTLIRDTESARQRFEQEARTMMRVRHPAVARFHLYERVRDASGRPTDVYLIAMEFVDGIDLARLVRRDGPTPWRFAAKWAADVLGGLAEIHRHGFVHRDVKPENIIVSPPPGPGVGPAESAAKLLDFGAVRRTGGEEAAERVFIGTREYAAPEQWSGTAFPATDLYALGGSLYFLLTGRYPYVRDRRDAVALREAHLREPIPDLTRRNPDVPPALDELYRRMMAKDPDMRGTAAGLAEEFRAVLGLTTTTPTAPVRPGPATASARPLRSTRPGPVASERGWAYRSVVDPVLALLERVLIQGHHRPPPGREPAVGDRLAALFRRPATLFTLAVLIALVLFLLFR